jgi:hypothetical protein
MKRKMLNNVMTTSEAAAILGIPENTVRVWCVGQKGYPPRFKEGEFAKSGGTWLVTLDGVKRLGKQHR